MEDMIPEPEKEVKEEEEEEERTENGHGREEEEKRGGGIVAHILSSLASPLSPKAVDNSSNNGDCGAMNSLISNLFHHSGEENHGRKNNGEEEREEENGKGGIIDSIVSNFPTSFPEDAVPTPDEASILIHSIVKD